MAKPKINRVARLMVFGIVSFVILLTTTIGLGWMLHHEITTTYAENYQALMDAGITDIIRAPEVLDKQMLVLVTMFPLIGAGLVFPFLLLAMKEIFKLSEEHPDL